MKIKKKFALTTADSFCVRLIIFIKMIINWTAIEIRRQPPTSFQNTHLSTTIMYTCICLNSRKILQNQLPFTAAMSWCTKILSITQIKVQALLKYKKK